MANWVSDDFSSVYKPYVEKHGAAYYLIEEGFIPNPYYRDVPEVRESRAGSVAGVVISRNKEIYGLVREIEKLDFLNKPQDFGWLFEKCCG